MVSAKSAKEVLIGLVALLAFVLIATMVAGTSDKAAHAVMALFIAFVILQLLFKANVFQNFLSAHPVITTGQTDGNSNRSIVPGIPALGGIPGAQGPPAPNTPGGIYLP